ncbi:MAG TPA: hypothetical protein VN114_03525 [Oxalicibacterium sp.]|uniref:hypothetical protein n=1 Tax=Oxalicibacterium sp. TaxID=2766525 RepID=UPI002C1173B2|nr:hypothetical protein [Oxalicibacterium sp.]HWU97559.1 hypothetical protein [Oxalicibacterium sp.]
MNRLVKTALLWLLALALPVQGWAAATQLSCAPVIHQVTQAGDIAMHASHHMTEGEGHSMQAEDAHSHASTNSPVSRHVDMKCSACAACNVGMTALPSVHDWPLLPVGSIPAVAAPAATFLAYIPDGIKRPPRSILV